MAHRDRLSIVEPDELEDEVRRPTGCGRGWFAEEAGYVCRRCSQSRSNILRTSPGISIRLDWSRSTSHRRSKGSAQHIGGLARFEVGDLLDVAPEKQYETFN